VQAHDRADAASGLLVVGGVGGLSIAMTPRLSLAVEATLSAELIKRDGGAAVLAVPAGWLGVVVGL
jgi:hypothetical protein